MLAGVKPHQWDKVVDEFSASSALIVNFSLCMCKSSHSQSNDIVFKNNFGKTFTFLFIRGNSLDFEHMLAFPVRLLAIYSEKMVEKELIYTNLISAVSHFVVAFSLSLPILDMD